MLVVTLCGTVAWRLWRQAPQVTAVGQVNVETADAHSSGAGTLVDLPAGRALRVFDAVAAGQVVARVEDDAGKWTDVTAPLAGQVVQIHRQPGQPVTAGQPVLTVASSRGRYVTAYVRGERGAAPGAAVEVRAQSDANRSFRAVVERVGPQYQPVPAAHLADRKAAEWGLPVLIPIPPDAVLRPGELVRVGWTSAPSTSNASNGGTTAQANSEARSSG